MRHELHRRSDPIGSMQASRKKDAQQRQSLDGMHARHSSTPHDLAGSFSAPATPPTASVTTAAAPDGAASAKQASTAAGPDCSLPASEQHTNGSGPAPTAQLGPDPMRVLTFKSPFAAASGTPLTDAAGAGNRDLPAIPSDSQPPSSAAISTSQGVAAPSRPAASGPLGPDPMRAPTFKGHSSGADGPPPATAHPGGAGEMPSATSARLPGAGAQAANAATSAPGEAHPQGTQHLGQTESGSTHATSRAGPAGEPPGLSAKPAGMGPQPMPPTMMDMPFPSEASASPSQGMLDDPPGSALSHSTQNRPEPAQQPAAAAAAAWDGPTSAGHSASGLWTSGASHHLPPHTGLSAPTTMAASHVLPGTLRSGPLFPLDTAAAPDVR